MLLFAPRVLATYGECERTSCHYFHPCRYLPFPPSLFTYSDFVCPQAKAECSAKTAQALADPEKLHYINLISVRKKKKWELKCTHKPKEKDEKEDNGK